MANLFDAIASAAANIVTQIRDYIDTVALVEKDPTVPQWAKADVKPTYGVNEIKDIATVAKTGSYKDLNDQPDLKAIAPDHSTEEYDTGRKWINGETIYAMDFEVRILLPGTGNDPGTYVFDVDKMPLAGRTYIHIDAMTEDDSGAGPCPFNGPRHDSSSVPTPRYSFLNTDGTGVRLVLAAGRACTARGTVYYIKE